MIFFFPAQPNSSIISCTKLTDGRVGVQMYFTIGNGRNGIRRKENDGITVGSLENENSLIRCRFSRKKVSNDPEIFNLNTGNYYYILMAAGPTLNNLIDDHKYDKSSSMYPIDLTKDSTISAASTLNIHNQILSSLILSSFVLFYNSMIKIFI